jgi:hypothetical protein
MEVPSAKEYPQPCIKRCSDLGEMWARNQVARLLSIKRPNQSTQTPRFSGTAMTSAPPTESPSAPRNRAKTPREAPSAHYKALKKVMDHH